MATRWVKACFLLALGIVILVYADKLVADLRIAAEGQFDVAFAGTWSLMTWLLWVLVAWLFVDAALTVALSFTEQKHTLGEVVKRLGRIEDKLGIPPGQAEESERPVLSEETSGGTQLAPEEVPPPPAL